LVQASAASLRLAMPRAGRSRRPVPSQGPAGKVRLQRVMADAGVAARRECERLIETGHVEVNGERMDRLPVFVDPEQDEIRVDGRLIKALTKHLYLLWHKPSKVLATPPMDEYEGRPTVADYVSHPSAPRLFPVGTLGFDATGLILLTSDTKLASVLSHPRSGVERVYHARVKGTLDGATMAKLRKGVIVFEREFEVEKTGTPNPRDARQRGPGPRGANQRSGASRPGAEGSRNSGDPRLNASRSKLARPNERQRTRRIRLEVRALDPDAQTNRAAAHTAKGRRPRDEAIEEMGGGGSSAGNTAIEIITTETRDEYIVQALQLIGHPVRKLTRVAIGPLRLREIGPGAWREMSREEAKEWRKLVETLLRRAGGGGGGAGGGERKNRPASAGPGKRRPRVIGGAAAKAPIETPAVSEEGGEVEGIDPEEFEE